MRRHWLAGNPGECHKLGLESRNPAEMQQVEGAGRAWVGGEGRKGLYGQNCAQVAWEAEGVQGRGMLAAALLLLKSLGDGGMRDKGHIGVP